MAQICQRSPCDRFLAALGRFIEGSPKPKPDGFVLSTYSEDIDETQYEVRKVPFDYCPFCGTHLSDLDEEYLLVKKARSRGPRLLHAR